MHTKIFSLDINKQIIMVGPEDPCQFHYIIIITINISVREGIQWGIKLIGALAISIIHSQALILLRACIYNILGK